MKKIKSISGIYIDFFHRIGDKYEDSHILKEIKIEKLDVHGRNPDEFIRDNAYFDSSCFQDYYTFYNEDNKMFMIIPVSVAYPFYFTD